MNFTVEKEMHENNLEKEPSQEIENVQVENILEQIEP